MNIFIYEDDENEDRHGFLGLAEKNAYIISTLGEKVEMIEEYKISG